MREMQSNMVEETREGCEELAVSKLGLSCKADEKLLLVAVMRHRRGASSMLLTRLTYGRARKRGITAKSSTAGMCAALA